MTTRLHSFAPLALALACGFLLVPAEEPKFGLAAEAKLTKMFTVESTLSSTSVRMAMGESELPSEITDNMKLEISSTETYTFVDEYEAVAEGRPTKFVRTFEKTEGTNNENFSFAAPGGESQGSESKKERTSPLEGRGVRFTWNAEKESFKKTAVEGEMAEALLSDLEADTDMLGFLPGKDVKDGDSWKIEPKHFRVFDAPGGNLSMQEKDGDEESDDDRAFSRTLVENLTGEAKGTWRGVRDEDGRKLGVIAIEAKLKTHADGDFAGKGENASPSSRKLKLEYEIEGEILWDMETMRVHSYEVGGPLKATLTQIGKQEGPSGEIDLTQEFELEGESKHSLDTE